MPLLGACAAAGLAMTLLAALVALKEYPWTP